MIAAEDYFNLVCLGVPTFQGIASHSPGEMAKSCHASWRFRENITIVGDSPNIEEHFPVLHGHQIVTVDVIVTRFYGSFRCYRSWSPIDLDRHIKTEIFGQRCISEFVLSPKEKIA